MLHAIVADAASSMPALRQFVATRLDLADEQEQLHGEPEVAEAMRTVWHDVLESLDVLDRAIAAEQADLPTAEPAVA